METHIALDYDVVYAGKPQRLMVLAQVVATAAAESRQSALNISAVIDRSGSMAGKKLEYVKKATQLIPQYLSGIDRLSLVVYDSEVEVRLAPRPVIDKDYIRHIIQKITTGGSTNLSGGWLQGCQLVSQEMFPLPEAEEALTAGEGHERALSMAQLNRVFLLTDGMANVGIVEPDRLEAMAAQKRDEGIVTTTIGVGMDFNEDLLVRMAKAGGGEFFFIDSPDQASQIFSQMLGYLIGISAQNLTVTVTLKGDAQLVQQISQYPQQETANRVTYRMGDMTRDERKTLLLMVDLPTVPSVDQLELATIVFEYDDVSSAEVVHRTIEQTITVRVLHESEVVIVPPNAAVQKAHLRLQATRAREQAIREADKRDFQSAKQTLQQAADAIEQANLEDSELQTEHDLLREEAMDMELGQQQYDSFSRKFSTSIIGSTDSQFHTQIITGATQRLKESREALERHGATPTVMIWRKESLALTMDELTIGKAEDNMIVVPEEGVSRYHCRIVREGDTLFLEDLTSRNGTFANRGRVGHRFRLSVGDVVTVGTWLFRFEA